jgi:crotonobetainyl-CoA:carnitine CoA-transferase CaiB-like acyl-CoA transferase
MSKAETDSETANPSVHGVSIADSITGRMIAAASLYLARGCADGRALAGVADADAFWLIFDKRITKSERPARTSLAQTAPWESANPRSLTGAESRVMSPTPIDSSPSECAETSNSNKRPATSNSSLDANQGQVWRSSSLGPCWVLVLARCRHS